MPATFPTALNNFSSGDIVESEEWNAIEAKIGIDSSGAVTSLDYLLTNSASIDPGHLHTTAGDVSKVGTPVDNQVCVWTGNGTIEGTANFTYDGSGFLLNGNVTLGADGTISSLILTEKASVALDPAGGADGDYSGITISGTAGATIAFGEMVYLQASDSRWELTDADAVGTAGTILVGICVLDSTDGGAITVLLQGTIRADAAFPTLTIGAPVYIGTTPGAVQVAAPTGTDDVIRVAGFALTANEIYFNPDSGHITHT